MSRIRTKHTKAEIVLRKMLWSKGARYRLHQNMPGKPDLVFIKAKLAVFVDGCFWHCCPLHYTEPKTNAEFWRTKIDKNRIRDLETTAKLEALGWTVIRLWEHEIKEEVGCCAERILQKLHQLNSGSR